MPRRERRNYSLPKDVLTDLENEVPKGDRSQEVEQALRTVGYGDDGG